MKLPGTGIVAAALALVTTAVAPAAIAQPAEVEVAGDADYFHEWTGFALPPVLAGFDRDSIHEYQERASNMGAQYSRGRETFLTIYLFRHGGGDASVWHDRALHTLKTRDIYSDFDPSGWVTEFYIPTGSTETSGILTSGESKGDIRATAVSIHTSGEWMVKLRMSSRTMGREAMVADMQEVLGQLAGAVQHAATAPGYLVESCPSDLEFRNSEAVTDQDRISELSVVAGMSVVTFPDAEGKLAPSPAPRYCRDGESRENYSIYRPNASETRYMIAMRDAGMAVEVTQVGRILDIFGDGKSDNREYAAILRTSLDLRLGGPFKTMPTPQQAYDAAFGKVHFSTVTRPLAEEGVRITVTPPGDETKD